MFFYFNVLLKDKLVIELNSLANVDSLRSRKFVCSLNVVDSSSWNFFLCTTSGVVLVLMIRVSDRIVDVPCEINSLRWDKVCLVQETVMSEGCPILRQIYAWHCIVLTSDNNTVQKHNNKERSKTIRNLTMLCINLSEYWTSMLFLKWRKA